MPTGLEGSSSSHAKRRYVSGVTHEYHEVWLFRNQIGEKVGVSALECHEGGADCLPLSVGAKLEGISFATGGIAAYLWEIPDNFDYEKPIEIIPYWVVTAADDDDTVAFALTYQKLTLGTGGTEIAVAAGDTGVTDGAATTLAAGDDKTLFKGTTHVIAADTFAAADIGKALNFALTNTLVGATAVMLAAVKLRYVRTYF